MEKSALAISAPFFQFRRMSQRHSCVLLYLHTWFWFSTVSFATCPREGSICRVCENTRPECTDSHTSLRFALHQEPSRKWLCHMREMHATEWILRIWERVHPNCDDDWCTSIRSEFLKTERHFDCIVPQFQFLSPTTIAALGADELSELRNMMTSLNWIVIALCLNCVLHDIQFSFYYFLSIM